MSDSKKNYKHDWVIPYRVVGLTHYTNLVTMEEFQEIGAKGQMLMEQFSHQQSGLPLHGIIDNRKIDMPNLLSLTDMLQAASYMNHPLLRWIIVIVPEKLQSRTESMPVEQVGDVQLKNVNTVAEAIEHLKTVDSTLNWQDADKSFFPGATI